MDLFHKIDDGQVILRGRGVFKQVPLYQRGDKMYAAALGGYVRLLKGGGTSSPNVNWLGADIAGREIGTNDL